MRASMMDRARLAATGEALPEGTHLVSPGVDASLPVITRQSEAAACDINNIMRQYEKTGVLPQAFREGVFADVSEFGDYQSVRERLFAAEAAFMELPAKVRSRFANDAAKFLDFVSDERNRDEMVEMGLIPAPAAAPADGAGAGAVDDRSAASGVSG